jgi:hypothetical protein
MARKRDQPTFYAADGIRGSPSHPERSFPDSEPKAASLKIRGFVADIASEFILGLDILSAYDASVDIGRQTLRLAEEEVSLWSSRAGLRPSTLVLAKDHVIPAQSEGVPLE